MPRPDLIQKLSPRWRKRLIWATAVFLVYTFVGFLVLPAILKWQLVKQLPPLTKRQVAVQQVRMNPWTWSLTIRGLALTEPTGEPFASWDEFHVNFQASSLFRWAWTFKEIRLVQPRAQIVLLKDGSLNFANLFPPATNPPPPATAQTASSVPRVNIFHLQITNGFLGLEDQTRRTKFRTEYRPINVDLTRFTTRPNSDTPYSFRAESDAGRSVTWAGDLTVQPLRSAGRLEVTGIMIPRYQPYLEEYTTARLTNGVADVHLTYRFALGTNGLDLTIKDFSLHVNDLQVLDPTATETVTGFRRFSVEGAGFDLRERQVSVESVTLEGATLLARLNPDGRLNLVEMLTLPEAAEKEEPSEAAPSEPWVASLTAFALTNASVVVQDLSRPTPFRTQLQPINLALEKLATTAEAEANYRFDLATESSEKISGSGSVCINPVRSQGEVAVEGVTLPKYTPFVEPFFLGKVQGGKLDVRVPYQVALVTNQLHAAVSNMVVRLADLEIKSPQGDETVLAVETLAVDPIHASLAERQAGVGKVSTQGGNLLVRRDSDGAINLMALLVPQTNAPSPEAPAGDAPPAAPAWAVRVDEVDLQNYTLRLEDQQPAPPASFLVDQIALNLKGISSDLGQEVQPSLSLRVNEGGTLRVEGKARVQPAAANLKIELAKLDLRAAQPYLNEFTTAEWAGGEVSLNGQATFDGSQKDQPQAAFNGDFRLEGFKLSEPGASNAIVGWESLALTGIDAKVQPNQLRIGELRWAGPQVNVGIDAEGKLNLTRILKPRPAPPTETSAPAATNRTDFPIEIGAVLLESAGFGFTDESLQPAAQIAVHGVTGSIKGLSSTPGTSAEIDLKGEIGERSPFAVTGQLNPLAPDTSMDLTITNANTQLTPLSPYMEKYGGYPLLRGRVSTGLRYQLQNKELKAEHKVQIQQLTLGARNNSPDATTAPVKLGVALLKDGNGNIDLDVPVTGRLDDPQFRVGPIIMQVVLNLIVKAAASPFKLLGGLVGGGEELSFVDFAPGGDAISETEAEKLVKLSRALAQRPALSLEIAAAADPVADRAALARQKLQDQIQAKHAAEMAAEGGRHALPEGQPLPPEEYERILRNTFVEQFGTNIAAVLQTNQAALAAAPAPASAKKAPVHRRVLAVIGLGGSHKTAAEKRLSKADREALSHATPEVMERLLAGTIAVSEEELGALMERRAKRVEAWLVESGQVAADRLLVLPPKQTEGEPAGQARVNLALN